MEELSKSIKNLQLDAAFVEKIQDFVNKNEDPTSAQRILSLLYTQYSSRIKESDASFVESLERSVVLLIKFLLTKDLERSTRTSVLRAASNFSVVFHQRGHEKNNILSTSVSSVVSLIQKNIILTPDEVKQSLTNFIALQTSCLSKSSALSTEIRLELWNHLVYLYKPMPDKTKLIALLPNGCYNPTCDISYLKSCAELFTRHNLDILFAILDKYCAYFLDKGIDSSQLIDVSNTIISNVINDIQCSSSDCMFEFTLLLIYKYSFERTFQVSQSSKESINENLAVFNSKMNNLLALLSTHERESDRFKLCSLLMTGMLNHLGLTQSKFICSFRKASTVELILEMYRNLFKFAKILPTIKGRSQNLFKCWFVCISLIVENLNLEQLPIIQTLNGTNDCITSLLLSMFNETEGNPGYDRRNLSSFISTIGFLSQCVNKLDVKNRNKTINQMLVKTVLDFFLAIPEHMIETVAELMPNVIYNCLKSSVSECQSSSMLLECLEPLVLLACRSLHIAPHAAKIWIRLQHNHRRKQSEHEWVHLCDHVDRILPQLRLKHADVTFVDTSRPEFVLGIIKQELDELFMQKNGHPETNCSSSYESSVVKRVLLLIKSSPAQDLALADVCLSCIFLIYRYENLSSECAQMKAYVAELKKVFKSMKSISAIRRESEIGTEQNLVTQNTLACLLLSNYFVLEHMEKLFKARAEQKKLSKSGNVDLTSKKRVINDVDKGIEQDLNETNVFPSEIDDTDEMIKVLDSVALVLSKVIQTEVVLDLEKILSVIKVDRFLNHVLYVAYSYRLFLEGDKEIEFWKLSLQLSVLLNHDGFFVECVYNLLWLDEGLRPAHLKRADDIVNATSAKSTLLEHTKTLYLCSKVKQMLSLNEVSKASEALAKIKIEHKEDTLICNLLPLFYHWYLNCQILMKQPELTPTQHAYIVQCCEEAFFCLFRNYNTVSHTNPVVVQVFSCYLDITKLIIKFHTAHLNPKDGRRILSTVLGFTQEMCLPLWTAQLLSLSAGLDVMTCNKEDLHFKTSCLEQILIQDISLRHLSAESTQHKMAQINDKKPVKIKTDKSRDVLITCEEAMRDAVVTKQTVASSSLASPRFVSTVTDKLPDFISHRSCRCFQCRNSVYQELLVSLELLRGLYYQLQADYDLTLFCFHNAEHLLSKLKILKGLPDSVASVWQGRIVFYRANLAGIMNRPSQVLELNEKYQLITSSANEDYFVRYCDFAWQQEQFLMFVAAGIQVERLKTPPRKLNHLTLPTAFHQFKTPKVSNLNIRSIITQNTKVPACKLKQDVITPKTNKVGETLVFDEDKVDTNTSDDCKENTTPKKKNENLKEKETVEVKTTMRKPRRVKLPEPVIDEDETWSSNKNGDVTKTEKCYGTAKKLNNQKPPVDNTFTPLVSEKFTSTQISPTTSQSKSKQNRVSRKVLFEKTDEDNKLNNNMKETMKPPDGKCKPCQGTNLSKPTRSALLERKPRQAQVNREKTCETKIKSFKESRRNINLVASKSEDPIEPKNYKVMAKSNTGRLNKDIADTHVDQLTININDLKIKAEKAYDFASKLDASDASSYHSCSTSPEIIRPTRNKALLFDEEDTDIDHEKQDQTSTTKKPTSTQETNTRRNGQIKAPLKSISVDEKDKEPVKAIRKKVTEKTDVANRVKSISSRIKHEKFVEPPPNLLKAIPRRPIQKLVNNTCEIVTKHSKIETSSQPNDDKVESSQTSDRTMKSSRKPNPVSSKLNKSTATTFSLRMSSRSKSSNTSESSHSPRSLFSSERSSSSSNKSSLISTKTSPSDVSVLTVSSGGSIASDLCTGSSNSDRCSLKSGRDKSLLLTCSPSSVESLIMTNARTGGKSSRRKVVLSSSSSTLSSTSSCKYESLKSDSFHSVKVHGNENQENEVPNKTKKIYRNMIEDTEAPTQMKKDVKNKNKSPNKPKAKRANRKDHGEIKSPNKMKEVETSTVPRSEKIKRKPRAQLPKNPFIF